MRLDAVLRHLFGNASQACNGGGNALSGRKCNEPHVWACWRGSRSCPAHLEEMPMGRCGGRLEVDDQHLELRERFSNRGHDHSRERVSDVLSKLSFSKAAELVRDGAPAPRCRPI